MSHGSEICQPPSSFWDRNILTWYLEPFSSDCENNFVIERVFLNASPLRGVWLITYLGRKSGYDPDTTWVRAWWAEQFPRWRRCSQQACAGGSAPTWDSSQTQTLHKASQLDPGSRGWHVDRRAGDTQGCCTGGACGGKGAGRKWEVEANANSPAALLINLYAAPTQSTRLCQGLWSFATVQRATQQGFRASSLTPQTEWEDKEIKQFSSV